MIAVDTNILVHAHRRDSSWHEKAGERVRSLAESSSPWAIPWPCIHEFLAVVTHPRIFKPPSTLRQASEQVAVWLESPSLVNIGESADYWPVLRSALESGRVVGPRVHDARIAAICEQHGITELWSADRDFSRFGKLTVTNPLIGSERKQARERRA